MIYSYPLWLLIFAILPSVILWIFRFNQLKRYAKVLIGTLIFSLIFSLAWDYLAINDRVWYFEKPHISSIYLLALPIEEWIFIIAETLLFSTITIILWEKYGVNK